MIQLPFSLERSTAVVENGIKEYQARSTEMQQIAHKAIANRNQILDGVSRMRKLCTLVTNEKATLILQINVIEKTNKTALYLLIAKADVKVRWEKEIKGLESLLKRAQPASPVGLALPQTKEGVIVHKAFTGTLPKALLAQVFTFFDEKTIIAFNGVNVLSNRAIQENIKTLYCPEGIQVWNIGRALSVERAKKAHSDEVWNLEGNYAKAKKAWVSAAETRQKEIVWIRDALGSLTAFRALPVFAGKLEERQKVSEAVMRQTDEQGRHTLFIRSVDIDDENSVGVCAVRRNESRWVDNLIVHQDMDHRFFWDQGGLSLSYKKALAELLQNKFFEKRGKVYLVQSVKDKKAKAEKKEAAQAI